MYRYFSWIFIIYFLEVSCVEKRLIKRDINNEIIAEGGRQDTLFRQLMSITKKSMSDSILTDSLAFLILPVEAACPACRKKVIDSLIEHEDSLDSKHFVIVSGTSNRNINSYLVERGMRLPVRNKNVLIDSTNQAFKMGLIFTEPTVYYAYNQRAYQKITCIPSNVKKEMHLFFSRSYE
jgi:hypothetical protein